MANPFGPVDWSDPVADHPLNRALTGWWLAGDENPFWGGPLRDLKGRSHGALTNGPTWSIGPGEFGAVQLDGSDDYIDCGASSSLDVMGATQSFTFSAWLRYTNTTGYVGLAQKSLNSSSRSFQLFRNQDAGGYLRFQLGNSTATADCNTSTFNDGRWHFFTCVRDCGAANQLSLYVDGRDVTTSRTGSSASATNFNTSGTLDFGNDKSGLLGKMAGSVGAGWLHSMALSASDAMALFDQCRRGLPDLLNRSPTGRTFVPQSGSTASGAGSSSGSSTAAAVGASLAAVSASSAGTATASAVGASSATADGTSAGTAAASATGTSAAACAGTSAGSATASATGTSAATCAGTSAGTATASATGASAAEAVGSAAGTSTASAFSSGGTSADGNSAGTSTASATGQSTATAAGSASGSTTASAVGASTVEASGNISGSATASATGASIWAALAQATGMATASATGASLAAAAGTAAGTSTASGVSPASDNDNSPISYYEVEFFHDATSDVHVDHDRTMAVPLNGAYYVVEFVWGK